ncbi:MAG: hypothetical protein ACQETD_11480 [Pseudomonadota bacterium]
MGTQMFEVDAAPMPKSGTIYRTVGGESLLVLGVRQGRVFVECPDGSFRHISEGEWQRLSPAPARC